jgi:hypothetical protein
MNKQTQAVAITYLARGASVAIIRVEHNQTPAWESATESTTQIKPKGNNKN